MAAALGVSPRTYSYYEQGERVPDSEALALLVRAGWNANWLLTGEGPERLDQLGGVTPAEGAAVPSQGLGLDALKIAFQVVAEALGPMKATPDQHFELVTISAELLQEGFPEAKVLSIVNRTSTAWNKGDGDGGAGSGDATASGVR